MFGRDGRQTACLFDASLSRSVPVWLPGHKAVHIDSAKPIYITIYRDEIDDLKTSGPQPAYGLNEARHPVVQIMERHFRLKCQYPRQDGLRSFYYREVETLCVEL